MRDVADRIEQAEARLFAHYGVEVEGRMVTLADPPLRVRVLETGTGPAIVLIHGSGTLASTWAPLIPHLPSGRIVAVDLPGFGLSEPYDYAGRSLRRHAVAQLRSLLDALEIERAHLVGTSLGGMWSLCFAAEHPERVNAVVSLGVPAVALPGMQGDPWFTLVSTRGIGALAIRLKPPRRLVRSVMSGVLGRTAVARTPQEWFDVLWLGMHVPGYSRAMRSHMLLALRGGRPLAENFFGDDELRDLATRILFIWGDEDVYGSPDIGRRAVERLPDARLETISGNHAPFLDDPDRCGSLIADFTGLAPTHRAPVA